MFVGAPLLFVLSVITIGKSATIGVVFGVLAIATMSVGAITENRKRAREHQAWTNAMIDHHINKARGSRR